ncbi:MAG: carbamate kinase, partial [Clostridium sp.]|nr:carbamate kinase [Clostridium sp.]
MNKMKKRIVVALGGNALGSTPGEQITHVRAAAKIIADMASEGHEIIIGHGNGPQVGIINSAMDYAAANGPCTPYMPFPECGAMSQGFIGYHLQQALQQSLLKRKLGKAVVSVVTQVLVDKNDPAFENPTKPIGNFCTYVEAVKLEKEKGFVFVEDAGRGYRRVVPSPAPQRIVELGAIRKMIQSGLLVIAVGGGGIPVVEDDQGIHGIDAVIDKDRFSSKLAQELKADMLIILTAVDQVYINYNQPDQRALSELTLKEADAYI